MKPRRLPTVEQCAIAYVSSNFHADPHTHHAGYASNLSFEDNTAYSYSTPIARIPHRPSPWDMYPPVLLLDKNYESYSQSTSRHITEVCRAFHSPLYGGGKGKVISVYDLTDPLNKDALLQMVNEVDTCLHAACNTRKRLHTRIQYLTTAEARLQDIHGLTEMFDTFDSLIPPALSKDIYALNQIFHNIPTRSHPCALFSTHTQATVDSLTTLLALRALEK